MMIKTVNTARSFGESAGHEPSSAGISRVPVPVYAGNEKLAI
jgi:hypothetical protein